MSQSYEVGQVWQYKTRVGEELSRLYVVKIESWPNGEKIFHVFVDQLQIKNPMLAGGIQGVLPHAPVSSETLSLSVTRLDAKVEQLPDFSEGYEAWKLGYDAGDAGVLTIPISEIISLIEGVVNQKSKESS